MELGDFKLRVLQELGHPVIKINVSEDQLDNAIKKAITFYQRNHYDGSEQMFIPVKITEDIKLNKFVDFDKDVIGVTRVLTPKISSTNILSVDFIMTADAAWSAFRSGGGMASFYNMMAYRSMISETFQNPIPIRFNYNRGRAHLDIRDSRLEVDQWLCFECIVAIDPLRDTRMFEDPWLIDYATVCVKEVWGQTLKKYEGVQLPGGITLNGGQIYQEAREQRKEMEDRVISDHQLPIGFFIA